MRFNLLAPITGWEISTLISHFCQGLKTEIRLHMVQRSFSKLEEITELAIIIDNEINGIRQGNSLLSQTVASTNRVSINPDAMDISAFSITREEYDRRRLNGLCYNCGLGKHPASECRQPKTNKNNPPTRPNSKARIAELEAQLADLESCPRRSTHVSELEAKIAALEMEEEEDGEFSAEGDEEPLKGNARA